MNWQEKGLNGGKVRRRKMSRQEKREWAKRVRGKGGRERQRWQMHEANTRLSKIRGREKGEKDREEGDEQAYGSVG